MISPETIGVVAWVAASVAALSMGLVATITMRRAKVNPRSYVFIWLILFSAALIGISHLVHLYDSVWAERVKGIQPLLMIAAFIWMPDIEFSATDDPRRFVQRRWMAVVLIALGVCSAMLLPTLDLTGGRVVSAWDWGIVAAEVILGFGLVIRYLPVARGRKPVPGS